ncbi:RNA polymerase III subunit RPC82-domain-containing protein [Amanita rubescens]|nr:RNA polymerase III subunit RPC82-domain-containing protein [Amanita rubescens]
MADIHTSRLCVQIINSHFGPLTAAVASVLLTRGRLSFTQVVRFSSLKPWIVRAAILVLVQHNILWHAQTEDEGEVVEINIEECLMRLRFGKFVWLTTQIFGKAAAEIVQLILDHGKLRPPDIIEALSAGDFKGLSMYQQALYKLVANAYLKPSTVLSHISPRDKQIKYEAEERSKISGIPTPKELRQTKELANVRLKREEDEEKAGLKRKAQDQPGHRPSKKKLQEEEQVDEDVYFRLNYEKYNVHIRNSLIAKAAKERYNGGAARVIEALLKVTEMNQRKLTDVRTEPVSIASIVMQLNDEDDLASGLVLSGNKKPSAAACVKDYLDWLSSADNPSPAGKAAAFTSFLNSRVQVEFSVICKRFRQRVLEAVTLEKHGTPGVRIVRLLLETGKMDEKQISKIVMMAPKDVRPLLMALSTDSLISMQEVPKSADRNPTRTFYLWYVDLRKAYSMLLVDMYKTLYNISLRRQSECEVPEIKAVLEKRERIDVSQDETLLSRLERELLKGWEERQERLSVLEMRVEECAFILRDLDVFGNDDD